MSRSALFGFAITFILTGLCISGGEAHAACQYDRNASLKALKAVSCESDFYKPKTIYGNSSAGSAQTSIQIQDGGQYLKVSVGGQGSFPIALCRGSGGVVGYIAVPQAAVTWGKVSKTPVRVVLKGNGGCGSSIKITSQEKNFNGTIK